MDLKNRWEAPPRPAELTETRLVEAILEGHFPIGSNLPAERELAKQLGVTRPTLREALQRLARDGWIEIRHGRNTRVRNYWREGNLGVLGTIARHKNHIPPNFVPNLLEVRISLAPAYARAAVERKPKHVAELLTDYAKLDDNPQVFAAADWDLHRHLTIDSGNPVFTLILNGFSDLYRSMALVYFSLTEARARSRVFYQDLRSAALTKDPKVAESVTRQMMIESLDLWQAAIEDQGGGES
jgi:GntR family negative regulator for fad regulon and positive regulator of fabA